MPFVSSSRALFGLSGAALLALSTVAAQAEVTVTFEETDIGVVGTLSGALDVSSATTPDMTPSGSPVSGIAPIGPSLFTGGPLLGDIGDPIDSVPLGALTTIPDLDYYLLETAEPFGPGDFTPATASVGDPFGVLVFNPYSVGEPSTTLTPVEEVHAVEFLETMIAVPSGYAGEELSGSILFAGSSFDSLGVTPGDYLFDLVEGRIEGSATRSVFETRDVAPPGTTITFSFSEPAAVPLPAGLPLLLAGLGGFALLRRRLG